MAPRISNIAVTKFEYRYQPTVCWRKRALPVPTKKKIPYIGEDEFSE